ncbi:flexible cuticle protein 12-like isoform X2 [Ostrinia furnacalis]|uniref:flexible cuticle protein 12-like isoform X2 n=1 Tax=Ostrinia furnacalis TaxID=93504 RepID=UPI00103A4931|nr:flexible cuticle protein 12-like isoform X2 [Ostrinia furnacalis]
MVKNSSPVVTLAIAILCYLNEVHTYNDNTQIYKNVYNNNGLGGYSFEWEEGGRSPDNDGLVVRGEFGYIDPRGKRYSVRYIADANGYQLQPDDGDTRFNDRRIV